MTNPYADNHLAATLRAGSIGREDALCHWCGTQGIRAQPLSIAGLGEEDE